MKYLVEWTDIDGPEHGATVVAAPHALLAETTLLHGFTGRGESPRRCLRTTVYSGSTEPEFDAADRPL